MAFIFFFHFVVYKRDKAIIIISDEKISLWLKEKTNMKKIKFYSIAKVSKECETPEIITVVANKTEAREYICRYMLNANFDHFSAWCELQIGEKVESQAAVFENDALRKAWEIYSNTVAEPIIFAVLKSRADLSELLSVVRAQQEYEPFGCSYELPAEMTCYEHNKSINALCAAAKEAYDEYVQKKIADKSDD